MAENLKFLYFGNKKPNNEKETQKEEEENLVRKAEDAKKSAEDKERLEVEKIKILTKRAEGIYEKIKSSINLSKEAFIQKYIAKHAKERSL